MSKLDDVDLSLKLSRADGLKQLADAQRRLLALRLQAGGQIGHGKQLGPPLCVLFEGWDASGKGGAIRRLTAGLDPRHVHVAQFAAPTPREARHHFLWRFWPDLPGWGGMAVLDRSYYGRVLVERVEGFATKEEWTRAYDEIVAFEKMLSEEGMVLVKFWMHISDKEQLKRFKAREKDPLKSWKLTDEDWRNREKRPAYEEALRDLLDCTDHKHSRWHLIAADNKPYARVAVINQVIESLEKGLWKAGQKPIGVEASL
jgi:polyphosphate kinase 2 (PPK2 family)